MWAPGVSFQVVHHGSMFVLQMDPPCDLHSGSHGLSYYPRVPGGIMFVRSFYPWLPNTEEHWNVSHTWLDVEMKLWLTFNSVVSNKIPLKSTFLESGKDILKQWYMNIKIKKYVTPVLYNTESFCRNILKWICQCKGEMSSV
jgi:hypothetical protein